MAAIHFFKIILEHSLQQGRLKAPDKFIRKHGANLQNPVNLKPPDGTEWEINWGKHENGEVWFEKGWDEFVKYYSLGHGHLVLFKFEGTIRTCGFKVNIFDKSALEIDYPLHINLPNQLPQGHDSDSDSDSDSVEILYVKPPLHKVTRPKLPLSSPLIRPCKKIRAEESERGSNLKKIISDGNKIKSTKAEQNLVKFESQETAGGSNFSTKKSSKPMAIKNGKEKPLTCEEKERALEKVNTFTSKNPYFKIVMQPTSINVCLYVPANFVKQYLKENKGGPILLRVSDGRTWRVKSYKKSYKREAKKRNRLRITTGWLSFVKENNLKEGDVCVFVLTNTIDISFLVHVFAGSANLYG